MKPNTTANQPAGGVRPVSPIKIETDEELVAHCDDAVKHRRRVEIAIVHRLLRDLDAAGFGCDVDDGGDEGEEIKGSEQELVNAVFSVDSATIRVFKAGKQYGVSLVMGNDGYDVISDYSMSLDYVIDPIIEWASNHAEAGTVPAAPAAVPAPGSVAVAALATAAPLPTLAELRRDPSVSDWLKRQLDSLEARDPLDFARDAELLSALAAKRLAEVEAEMTTADRNHS